MSHVSPAMDYALVVRTDKCVVAEKLGACYEAFMTRKGSKNSVIVFVLRDTQYQYVIQWINLFTHRRIPQCD